HWPRLPRSVVATLSASCGAGLRRWLETAVLEEAAMATKRMKIEGMTCLHCENTVAQALARAGASKVEANWPEGRASFDVAGPSGQQLKAAVEEAGYRVVSIQDAQVRDVGLAPLVGAGSHDYDLVVLGSGSAAFAAAITATEAGARVALMESNVVGGTCV